MVSRLLLDQKGLVWTGIIALSGLVFMAFALLVYADVTGSLLPLNDGTYQQWTPKSGTTHYVMVDEATCNGTVDYNSTSAVGNRDSYYINLSSIPTYSTITQIEIKPCASKNATGGIASVMNVFYRFDGTNSADAGSYSLNGTTPVELTTTSFSGLSLVKNPVSSLQIGAVLSSGNKGARLSRITARITYTLPAPPEAPSNLTATNTSTTTNSVFLQWIDNSATEDGFVIERSTDNINFATDATTTANVTSYDDVGMANGTYYYRVRAFNGGGYSAYSNTASVTVP